MNVRIDSILKSVDMEERGVLDSASVEELEQLEKEYSNVTTEKIASFRDASIIWLNHVLSLEMEG
jgi:hypothetical protein